MKKLLVVCALLLVSACAQREGASFAQATQSLQPLSASSARIYIYRKDEDLGSGLKPDVFVNGQNIGDIVSNSFLIKDVAAGNVVIAPNSSIANNEDLTFVAQAGQIYYVKINVITGFWMGKFQLNLMSNEQAASDLRTIFLRDASK